MTYEKMFRELMKVLPSIKNHFFPKKKNTIPEDGTRNILANEELSYEECEVFIPLLDGDVVFCPSVYDGDSFRLCWIHGGRKVRIMGRLSGVDTPELRGSSEKEKALAIRAKKRLEDIIKGKFVTIRNPATEKYGRSMSDLEIDEIHSVSDYMLEDPEICRPYEGGTKVSWD